MLHKLSLVVNNDNPSLVKEAVPDTYFDLLADARRPMSRTTSYIPEGVARAVTKPTGVPADIINAVDPFKAKLEQKQRTLAHGRGYSVAGDMDKLRMSKTKITATPAFKNTPKLTNKMVQETASTVTPAKQLRHRLWGPLVRAWGGQGFLGGKWRNRAGMIGGLGALGLGIKAYMDSNKELEPFVPPPVPQEEYPSYDDLYYKQGASIGSKYVQDAVTIPKATPVASVPMPGPGVGTVAKITPKGIGSGKGSSPGATGGVSGGSEGGGRTVTAMDEGVLPLLGLGAGGVGGWALAKKLIDPMMDKREQALQEQIKNTQKWRKAAPIGAAAAGALLLAALAAVYAKQKQEEKQAPRPRYEPYDPTEGGFYPSDQVYPGNFYG